MSKMDRGVVPMEIYGLILEHFDIPPEGLPRSYGLQDEAIAALLNVSTVNHTLHELATDILYRHLSIQQHQITPLCGILWPRRTRSRELCRRVRSLHLEARPIWETRSSTLHDTTMILHALSPTLRRLFLDVDLNEADFTTTVAFHRPYTLNMALSSMNALQDYFICHPKPKTLPLSPPSASPIKRLALLYAKLEDVRFFEMLGQYSSIEELVLFQPMKRLGSPLPNLGEQLIKLYQPPTKIKSLVIVYMVSGPTILRDGGDALEALKPGMLFDMGREFFNKRPDVIIAESTSVSRIYMGLGKKRPAEDPPPTASTPD